MSDRMDCITKASDMKVLIGLAIAGWLFIIATIIALASTATAEPRRMSFADMVIDIKKLAGTQVELEGVGQMHGDDMLLYRDQTSRGTFIFVQLDDLRRDQRKRVLESCYPSCEVVVQGEVGEDEQGNKGIIASMIQVK